MRPGTGANGLPCWTPTGEVRDLEDSLRWGADFTETYGPSIGCATDSEALLVCSHGKEDVRRWGLEIPHSLPQRQGQSVARRALPPPPPKKVSHKNNIHKIEVRKNRGK